MTQNLILSHCLEKLNILARVCAYLDKALMHRDQGEYKDTCIWVIPTKGHGLNTLTIHPFEDRRACRIHRLSDTFQLTTYFIGDMVAII